MIGPFVRHVDMKLEQRNENIPVASLSPVEEAPGRINWPGIEELLVFTALVRPTAFTGGNPVGWVFG